MNALVQRICETIQTNPITRNHTGNSFKTCPPCDERILLQSEERLGFVLPEILRSIYTNGANGGFGPGYGVMGIIDGFTDDQKTNAVDLYQIFMTPNPEDEDKAWQWPEGLLPFCHWGCAVYSSVQCNTPPYPVYLIDFSVRDIGEPMEKLLRLQRETLARWFEDWLEGKDLWENNLNSSD